ncbi:hypothetical protein Hanom_Chr05g00435131 [Helianthus anomalus]
MGIEAKFNECLLSQASGAMVVASLLDGRPLWLEQIRDNFLHPSNESLAAYANAILGDDGEGDTDFDVNPTREEPIVLSSADDASFHLIRCYSRAGPQRGPFAEPAADDVDTPVVDPYVGVVDPSKIRKKKIEDKSEEKKVEEPAVETPRKRPSNSSFLDYVVVSDTLSSLDVGVKRSERDPDDDAMLTEMMKKRKILEDKKKELDAQAAAALAEKKSKLQKETTKTDDRLEKYPTTPKSGRFVRKIDISKITPPTSPPSKPLDLSPPRTDLKGKVKEDDVEVEKVGNVVEDVAAGAGRGETHVEGVETEVESSEATPRGTIYTKRVSDSGGGGTSGIHHSPEYTRVQGGSWTNYNPACDDLPHTPQWTLTQGSRMNDLSHCREFYSLSLPPAERLFQKTIVREWQAMGEGTLEVEVAKKELAEEREAFNNEKKGLLWRVADAEDKLAKEKQFNANKQKEWETGCERTNREMKTARDKIVKLKGEKTKLSDDHEQAVTLYQKWENEYIQRITKLEKIAAERTAESKASEILAEEANTD